MLIKAACKEKGMTLKDLSDKTGYSVVSIYRWEKGLRAPNSGAIRALCEALGKTADELLEMLPNPTRAARDQAAS